MSTLTEPHTNGHDRELGGVRTYRGRKLEDLIPQIRAELGPDAIILRQREGLMGGVGGFFAQKCVEVDAQAGLGGIAIDRHLRRGRARQRLGADRRRGVFASTPPPAAAEPVPDPVSGPRPAPEARCAPADAGRAGVAPAPEAVPRPRPASGARGPDAPARRTRSLPRRPRPPAEGAAESFVTPPRAGRGARRHRRAGQARDHRRAAGDRPRVDAGARADRPRGPGRPSRVARPGRRRARSLRRPRPEPVAPAPAPVVEVPRPLPSPSRPGCPRRSSAPPRAPAPVPPAANPWVAKQAGDLDPNEAEAVAQELTSQGISDAWAHAADRRRGGAPLAAREGQPA